MRLSFQNLAQTTKLIVDRITQKEDKDISRCFIMNDNLVISFFQRQAVLYDALLNRKNTIKWHSVLPVSEKSFLCKHGTAASFAKQIDVGFLCVFYIDKEDESNVNFASEFSVEDGMHKNDSYWILRLKCS